MDKEIIDTGKEKFDLSEKEIIEQLNELTDIGLIEKNEQDNSFKLTENGIRYVEDVLMKKEKESG